MMSDRILELLIIIFSTQTTKWDNYQLLKFLNETERYVATNDYDNKEFIEYLQKTSEG